MAGLEDNGVRSLKQQADCGEMRSVRHEGFVLIEEFDESMLREKRREVGEARTPEADSGRTPSPSPSLSGQLQPSDERAAGGRPDAVPPGPPLASPGAWAVFTVAVGLPACRPGRITQPRTVRRPGGLDQSHCSTLYCFAVCSAGLRPLQSSLYDLMTAGHLH